ncbi:hypothetical protein Tco_0353408 [Tanacetum coccineum]
MDESSSTAHVILVIVEPVHYTIPLLVIETLQVRVEAAKQRSEVLQDSLKIARDMITELQIRVKDVEARLQ